MCCHHFFRMTRKVYQFYTAYQQWETLIKFGRVRIHNFTSFRSDSHASIASLHKWSQKVQSQKSNKLSFRIPGKTFFPQSFQLLVSLCPVRNLGYSCFYKPSLGEPWKPVLAGVRTGGNHYFGQIYQSSAVNKTHFLADLFKFFTFHGVSLWNNRTAHLK